MDKINRTIVKEQAKTIIKGKVFSLFLITVIVSILTGANFGFTSNSDSNDVELFRDNDGGNDYSDYYSDYYGYDYDENPIESFGQSTQGSTPAVTQLSFGDIQSSNTTIKKVTTGLSVVVGIIFLPLDITLSGMYLTLIRRKVGEQFSLGKELGGVFKNSFNSTYLNKLVLGVLRYLLLVFFLCLLIVPGVFFYFSMYFVNEILSDNPNLKPSEAIKLSRKMTKGHRSELFELELSFLGWYLLCIVSLGIALIYVMPYYKTTIALYYENFRIRALREGKITPDDFLSEKEKADSDYDSYKNNTDGSNYDYQNNTQDSNYCSNYYYSPQNDSTDNYNSSTYPPPQDNTNNF